MKIYKQSLVFSISALSAAMMCQTASVYASDIQIYKPASEVTGTTIMLTLDLSSSMSQKAQTPITKDFGLSSCTSKNYKTLKYKYNEKISYDRIVCEVKISDVKDNHPQLELIKAVCPVVRSSSTDYYQCPDRITMLKDSLFELIGSSDANKRLSEKTKIGLTIFPAGSERNGQIPVEVDQIPIELTDSNRLALLAKIASYEYNSNTPIARAYAIASQGLYENLATIDKNAAQCDGYGVYYLTDGESYKDDAKNALTIINGSLTGDAISTSTCEGRASAKNDWDTDNDRHKSWPCVNAIATKLYDKENKKSLEIKTAIVGFGAEFNFKDSSGKNVEFDSSYTKEDVTKLFSVPSKPNKGSNGYANWQNKYAQYHAALAGLNGNGGWYSADSTSDIAASVRKFVGDVEKSIPAVTTGTASIPQDTLNPIEVQEFAYFPQFQPTPSENYQLWSGNLKKYKVVNAVLMGLNDEYVFNDTNGSLNKNVQDLWVRNAITATTPFGGMLSKLKLQITDNKVNRTVYTNSDAQISAVDLTYIKADAGAGGSLTNRKYLLGLLGYNFTQSELDAIKSTSNLTAPKSNTELRNIGAVIHSTPVLLTQSGKVSANQETSDRDDYVLFGTTQGVLHVVKAGQEDAQTGQYTGGEEVFAFVPQETLVTQSSALLSEKESGDLGTDHLYYGVDGQWVVHTEYVYNPEDSKFYTRFENQTKDGKKLLKEGKQWVYGGMRMGGRSYYALDLTEISSPKVKFRIDPKTTAVYSSTLDGTEGKTTITYNYTHLAKMGQSWSKPVIANVQWKGKRRLVMFVGGGYDPGYESFYYDQEDQAEDNNNTGSGKGIGAGVFMFDANTGEPLWSTYESTNKGDTSYLKYSVVSQIKAVDRDGDGDVDHLYFGDLGGQVFRIDLNSLHKSNETAAEFTQDVVSLLDLNKQNGLSPRFYESPAFSVYTSSGQNFAVISIGSGNRSTPLLGKKSGDTFVIDDTKQQTVNAEMLDDAVYNLFDTDVVKKQKPQSWSLQSITTDDLIQITETNMTLDAEDPKKSFSSPENKIDFTGKKGWYYSFSHDGSRAVEKVQGDILVIANDLFVSTYDASTDMINTGDCGAGIYGVSNAYRFCMPYGQCPNGETATDNKLRLGQGLLGITIGGGSDGNSKSRSIVAPLKNRSTPVGNKVLSAIYESNLSLTPLSWYEKN